MVRLHSQSVQSSILHADFVREEKYIEITGQAIGVFEEE